MRVKASFGSILFDVFNTIFMGIIVIVMLYPMVYVFSASISDSALVSSGKVLLWPKAVTLIAYKQLVFDANLWNSYWNTIRFTSVHTLFTLIATSAMAYPLAKKWLP